MAIKKGLPPTAEGVFRCGVVDSVGRNDRSGQPEVRIVNPDNASFPVRCTVTNPFSPKSGEPISLEGLRPGVDRVALQVTQEVISPRGYQPFTVESVLAVFVIGEVAPSPLV